MGQTIEVIFKCKKHTHMYICTVVKEQICVNVYLKFTYLTLYSVPVHLNQAVHC